MEKATFAAGCFWNVEAAFRRIDGVIATTAGYTGGTMRFPTYEAVCTGTTGHIEAVEVDYDPDVVSYEELLEVFWEIHDPTQLGGQGADLGPQYKSAIFVHSTLQMSLATASKKRLLHSGKYSRPIVTIIEMAWPFYPAEEHHQQYYEKRGLVDDRLVKCKAG